MDDRIRYTLTRTDGAGGAGGLRESLSRVEGVSEVAVDRTLRTVTVRGTDLEGCLLRAAAGAAGYALVDAVAV
ncbi:transporter [Streptomyces sp. NPDC001380]|uniref:transporter n=1 Tax=Streptomyces sp. NPDC001380 TaxID=3364566 RepID=UPI0036B1EF9A